MTSFCYWCNGTGLLQSDEECLCAIDKCECAHCKNSLFENQIDFE